jgi:hypothetical protein
LELEEDEEGRVEDASTRSPRTGCVLLRSGTSVLVDPSAGSVSRSGSDSLPVSCFVELFVSGARKGKQEWTDFDDTTHFALDEVHLFSFFVVVLQRDHELPFAFPAKRTRLRRRRKEGVCAVDREGRREKGRGGNERYVVSE